MDDTLFFVICFIVGIPVGVIIAKVEDEIFGFIDWLVKKVIGKDF